MTQTASLSSDLSGWLFDWGGVAATYTRHDGSNVSMTILIGSESDRENIDRDDGIKKKRSRIATFHVSSSKYGGVADPKIGEWITVSGEKWTIAGVESMTSTIVRVRLERDEPREVSRRGLRLT